LNRDLRQVVILDDDPQAYQLQPENAIPIRPFTDGRDRSDHELKDLLPFLKALATERVNDFRLVLAEFRDEDGIIRDLPSKYGARVRSMEIQREQQKQKGFGGFIRGRLNTRPSNSSAVAPVSQ
jgi:import inner membrane translocase subunit TIM50